MRGGYILPQQIEGLNTKLRFNFITIFFFQLRVLIKILCLTISRQNNFTMIVALNSNNAAAGDLFWDDGETINTTTNGQYYYIRFSYAETKVNDVVSNRQSFVILTRISAISSTLQAVEGVLTMQVQNSTSSLTGLENLKMDSMSIFGLNKVPTSVDIGIIKYSSEDKVATLNSLDRPMTSDWEVVLHFD